MASNSSPQEVACRVVQEPSTSQTQQTSSHSFLVLGHHLMPMVLLMTSLKALDHGGVYSVSRRVVVCWHNRGRRSSVRVRLE